MLKENLKWNNILWSSIRRLNIINVAVFPKLILRSRAISVKIPCSFFVEIGKPILKFMWKFKGPPIAKTIA